MIEIVFVLFLIILINLFDIIEISNTTTDSLWHLNLRGRICYEIDDLFVSGLAFVFGSHPPTFPQVINLGWNLPFFRMSKNNKIEMGEEI